MFEEFEEIEINGVKLPVPSHGFIFLVEEDDIVEDGWFFSPFDYHRKNTATWNRDGDFPWEIRNEMEQEKLFIIVAYVEKWFREQINHYKNMDVGLFSNPEALAIHQEKLKGLDRCLDVWSRVCETFPI